MRRFHLRPTWIKPVSRQALLDIFLVLLCGVILCFMGFYNGFPLVFNDDGTYFGTAFGGFVPNDRPMIYGYFLRHISMLTSLWLVIWAQGIIVAAVVFYCFKYFSGTSTFRIYYIIYIFLITFCMGASVNVSQLIPDVFTSVSILCLCLLVFAPQMSIRDLVIVSILFIFALGVHSSHYLIVAILLIIFLIIYAFKSGRRKLMLFPVKIKRLLYAVLLVIFSNVMVSWIHYSHGLRFAVSSYGHVFLMGSLVDMGLVKQYLDENCKDHNYKFCAYKDNIPWEFIWDFDKSPLYKTGGWSANRKEYNEIIFNILTTPKYMQRFVARAAEATFWQFFSYDVGDTPPQCEGTPTFAQMYVHWPENLKLYLASRQSAKTLDHTSVNFIQKYLMAFILCVSLIVLFLPGFPSKFKWMIFFIVIALLANAFVCGVFSTVVPRYQSRVIWLLPLPLMIYLSHVEYFSSRFPKLFRKDPEKNPAN
jgi:hypothetical protein